MEVTSDDVKVCGMMHLLISGHFESKDHLSQTFEDVYRNFTSIYKAVVVVLDDLDAKFPTHEYREMSMKVAYLITFCRCKLMRIIMDDGITINPSFSDLLAEIESKLLYLVINKSEYSDQFRFDIAQDMMIRIGEVYLETASFFCYQPVINKELMIEFLNQCIEDCNKLNEYKRVHLPTEDFIVLRNYFVFVTKEQNHVTNLDLLLNVVEGNAYELSCYLVVSEIWPEGFTRQYGDYDAYGYRSSFRWGVLEALTLQLDGYSNSAPLSDELLNGYVKCVQDNLLELLKDKTFDPTGTMKGELMYLHGGLSFLMHLLIKCSPKHNSEQKKFSEIRLDFHVLARNIGSVICSCLENTKIENTSLGLFDLIEKVDISKEEIIKTLCCMLLHEMELESPNYDQLGSLILLLQNLKEFMDHNPGSIVTWKDHENLVLFIFYLVQNNIRGSNCVVDDEFCRNTLQLGVALINHDELTAVLVSAQVVAFNMSSYSLLGRCERFRWWELYMGDKEHVDMHMCVGILKAIGLSPTTDLTDELLIAYGECVQDSLFELRRIEAIDPLKDQFNILHEGFSFLVRLLITHRDEQEKLSHINVVFQNLLRSIGSMICSRFNTTTTQSTSAPSNLLEKLNLIKDEIEEILAPLILSKIGRESPKTNQLGSLNLHLENWKGLMECESDLIITWRDQFQMIHENFVFFKSFITSSCTGNDESKNLCSSIVDAGHVAEYLLTTISSGSFPFRRASLWISEFMSRVELIKASIMEINEKRGIVTEASFAGTDRNHIYAQAELVPTATDLVVGFELEMELIRKRLAARLKQLDVISIIGMPGLGKTTLTRKAYEDPYTKANFDVRAWCCVSQEYNLKELFLTILGSIVKLTDETREQSESELSVLVHKELTGRRYIIVLDDIWDINAYMNLKRFFPDDNKGSRIMLTSRSKVIGSQANCHSDLIEPRVFTDEQSWVLLEQKVYSKGKCPAELCHIGREIAKQCKGLPLAIVVIGGVLAKGTRTQDFWEQVRRNLSSFLARDSQSQFMAALELSYEYLPDCLKPMFLYLGTFPEDTEIHADKLMQLWTAEGFLQKTESLSLVIQAETSLMDLIDRSLVMVAKRRWDKRVKTCHVHDLLRDMCLAKAKEEKFMQQVNVHKEFPSVTYQRRLSISVERNDEDLRAHFDAYKDLPNFSFIPPIYSLLFSCASPSYLQSADQEELAPVVSRLKLLRVFDARVFDISANVLWDLSMLLHLRYLSFSWTRNFIPSSISRLRSLEILIVKNYVVPRIYLPESIWEMTKLRHVDIMHAEFKVLPKNSPNLENLVTFSTPFFDVDGDEKEIFRKVASLKKLKCIFKSYKGRSRTRQYPNFETLDKLESLSVRNKDHTIFQGKFKLPLTLKKLCMSEMRLEWSQISTLHTLPNLEFLRLFGMNYVEDESWDLGEDDVFTNLKFLKLASMKIERWNASSVNFPSLEKLVLDDCSNLEEIPSDLGEFVTLREIEVRVCCSSVVEQVKEIQKEQEEFGNDSLKFSFYLNQGE